MILFVLTQMPKSESNGTMRPILAYYERTTMNSNPLSPTIRRSVHGLAQRELGVPLLLFLAAHRPLAFLLGQAMHLLTPLASLLGTHVWIEWATLLSHPSGPVHLERYVLEEIDRHYSPPLAE